MSGSSASLVVFLHGPSGGPAAFDSLAGRLPERFPSIAPAVPWEGASSTREVTERLEESLRDEGRPVVLVARAHAAFVALEVARRGRLNVGGLVLSGFSDDPRDGFRVAGVPVLLLWGTDDAVTPPAVGRRLEQALPRARLLFLEDAGHDPMAERPSVYAFHLSSFLNDLSPRRVPSRRLVEEPLCHFVWANRRSSLPAIR